VSRAGFVLTGGKSSRMGQDKALLPFRGGTLAGHVAVRVEAAAGSVALIGDPKRYGQLGYPVWPDRSPGQGPLGGMETALWHSAADWNLIVACDMPAVSTAFLRELIGAAEHSGADALIPYGPSGRLEPLCAVYHTRCRVDFASALDCGVRKVADALTGLRVQTWPVADSVWFENLNTPEEWADYAAH
jgi:molybdenum cofactor guanylyltransferase